MDMIPSTIDRLRKSYINTYKLGIANGNEETFSNPTKKQEIYDHFLKLCALEQAKNDEMALIRTFDCASVDNFDKEYDKALKELKKNAGDPKNNVKFANFYIEMERIVILDSETQQTNNVTTIGDDMEVQETQILIDPISKQQIRDPVKNVICGHVYERNTIQEAIKINSKVRCAYMGCGNRQRVSLQHLQDDHLLKAKLDRLFTQQEQAKDEEMEF